MDEGKLVVTTYLGYSTYLDKSDRKDSAKDLEDENYEFFSNK